MGDYFDVEGMVDWLIFILCGLMVIGLAAVGISACMLASQISQNMGE